MIRTFAVVVLTALGWAVLYALGAFVAADLNITHWAIEGRFFIAVCACGVLALMLVADNNAYRADR